MDGLSLYASALELQKLTGGRIDKIQQTEREELIIAVRVEGENLKLLLNASASDNRVQLTDQKKPAPSEAPVFCMLLRKRIAAGRITAIEQANTDRVLSISIEARDELGDISESRLYCELMGKYSNIILVSRDGTVVDSIKRVTPSMSGVRPILPGISYSPPPSQDKLDPLCAKKEDIFAALDSETTLARALTNSFFGFSPAIAGALCTRFTDKSSCAELDRGGKDELASTLHTFLQGFSQTAEPCITVGREGEPIAVYPFIVDGARQMDSMRESLDALYAEKDKFDWIKRHGASVKKILQNNIDRCEKKLAIYSDTLNSTADMERCRLYGELLTANLHSLSYGMKEAAVDNYYCDPPERTVIPLDIMLDPGANAQAYFKRYQKKKAARAMAAVQRDATSAELDYLEGQLDNLGKCTAENELSELIEELRSEGYIKRERNKKRQKLPPSKPMRFISSDGTEILVGKNNVQNDRLTLHTAEPNDIWLHTKNIPGSHVIIRSSGSVSDSTLVEAATLAAYYSKARGSSNVPVDYTPRKYVKKPAGAKPGMVIYSTNRTVYATPSEAVVNKLDPALR